IRFTKITRIRRALLRLLPQVLLDLLQHRHQLLLVVGLLGDSGRHDDLGLAVHRDLSIVGLLKALARPVLHDPRIRIGKVALRLGLGLGLLWVRNLGRRALGLLSGLLLLPLPLGDASASRLGLLLGSRLGFLLQRPLGLANLLQPGFSLGQFRRQFISPPPRAVLPILGRVDGLGVRQQLGYFLFQFLFCLAHPFIAHRLMFGGVGFDLRPVQRYV